MQRKHVNTHTHLHQNFLHYHQCIDTVQADTWLLQLILSLPDVSNSTTLPLEQCLFVEYLCLLNHRRTNKDRQTGLAKKKSALGVKPDLCYLIQVPSLFAGGDKCIFSFSWHEQHEQNITWMAVGFGRTHTGFPSRVSVLSLPHNPRYWTWTRSSTLFPSRSNSCRFSSMPTWLRSDTSL